MKLYLRYIVFLTRISPYFLLYIWVSQFNISMYLITNFTSVSNRIWKHVYNYIYLSLYKIQWVYLCLILFWEHVSDYIRVSLFRFLSNFPPIQEIPPQTLIIIINFFTRTLMRRERKRRANKRGANIWWIKTLDRLCNF